VIVGQRRAIRLGRGQGLVRRGRGGGAGLTLTGRPPVLGWPLLANARIRLLGRGDGQIGRRRGWGEDPATVRLAGAGLAGAGRAVAGLAGRPHGTGLLLPRYVQVRPRRWRGSCGWAARWAGWACAAAGRAGRRGPGGPLVGTCVLPGVGGAAMG